MLTQNDFIMYFRMNSGAFDSLLAVVEPLIVKQNKNFRKTDYTGERLAITLWSEYSQGSESESKTGNVYDSTILELSLSIVPQIQLFIADIVLCTLNSRLYAGL